MYICIGVKETDKNKTQNVEKLNTNKSDCGFISYIIKTEFYFERLNICSVARE